MKYRYETTYFLKDGSRVITDSNEKVDLEKFDFKRPFFLRSNGIPVQVFAPGSIVRIESKDNYDTDTGTDGK